MKTSSAKAKGRFLQKLVVSKILNLFPNLTNRQVKSTPMGCKGDDVQLSEEAAKLFPFSIECKCQESLSIWAALKQAEGDNRDLTPLLVFKRNRSEVYCALKFEDFMRIISEHKECD